MSEKAKNQRYFISFFFFFLQSRKENTHVGKTVQDGQKSQHAFNLKYKCYAFFFFFLNISFIGIELRDDIKQ